jgi:hypothetical protein
MRTFLMIQLLITLIPLTILLGVFSLVILMFIPLTFWIVPLLIPVYYSYIITFKGLRSVMARKNSFNRKGLLKRLPPGTQLLLAAGVTIIYPAVALTVRIIQKDFFSEQTVFLTVPFCILALDQILLLFYFRNSATGREILMNIDESGKPSRPLIKDPPDPENNKSGIQ